METVKMTFELNPEQAKRLQDYAAQTGCTLSQLANDIIFEWFEDLDMDSRIAEEAYAEFVANGEKTYTREEVFGEPAA